MNRKKLIPIGIVVAVAIVVAIVVTRGKDNDGTLYGNVDVRTVDLAFRVSGRVAAIKVDEGDDVHKGQVLAVLDTQPLQYAEDAAAAELAAQTAANELMHRGARSEDIAQARAELQAAQAALVEAGKQLKRQRRLLPGGAVSQSMVDAAQSGYDQAAARVKADGERLQRLTRGFRSEEIAQSDAQLKAARAHLDSAQLALHDATLTAPSDGIVLTRAVEIGSMVNPGTTAFTISLTRPVWVRAYVNEPRLGQFASGTKVTLTTDSRPDQPYHGVVGFVSPTAEFTPKPVETADLRTSLVYRLRIVVNDPDRKLLQGMPVTVRLAP